MNVEQVRLHLARAERNASAADALGPALPDNVEWELVIRFYAVLHLIDAYLATKAERFIADRHEVRLRAIRESPELRKNPAFERAYRELKQISEQVRYDAGFVVDNVTLVRGRERHAALRSVLVPKIERRLH